MLASPHVPENRPIDVATYGEVKQIPNLSIFKISNIIVSNCSTLTPMLLYSTL